VETSSPEIRTESRDSENSEHESKSSRSRSKKNAEQPGSANPQAGNSAASATDSSKPAPLSRKATSRKGAVQRSPEADRSTSEKVEINVRTLLEAGVHFGHQTSRWNPAMAGFIYSTRNGIHIINLPRTIQSWTRARAAIVDVVAQGGNILFVGTKKQAHDAVATEAERCGAYYVVERWLGGMLTNYQTIRKSVDRLKKLEETLVTEEEALKSGSPSKFTKKERLMISREIEKLDQSLGGIREMSILPSLIFVIDIKREDIAVKEARRLDIPVVALVDTNCDPRQVTYPIPSNDDGTRAIRLFTRAIADAILEAKTKYDENVRLGKIKPQTAQNADAAPRSSRRGRARDNAQDSGAAVTGEASEKSGADSPAGSSSGASGDESQPI
jgi:small subunit ribosomal protein S2